MAIKMKYRKSSKKIKIEEIVDSITTYCDKIEQYLKGSIPLEQRIVYNALGVQDIKENAEKCLNSKKKGKISEEECARRITSGKGTIYYFRYRGGIYFFYSKIFVVLIA